MPQAPTAADLNRLESNLWHGLSIFDDTVDRLEELPSAEDGLGFIIGEAALGTEVDGVEERVSQSYFDDAPTEVPDTGHNELDDNTEWWQGDDDDV